MKAVRISDMQPDRNILAVDLRHVLGALAPRALQSIWRIRDVEATGDAAPEMESLKEEHTISGDDLSSMANNVVQVIDGVFTGFEPGKPTPWVIIEAVDSTYYVVHSPEPTVLDIIRSTFRHVIDDDAV